jgi:hypothetical protein
MREVLKIAYILAGMILLRFVWNGIDVGEGGDDLFSQLMKFRLVGFIALLLIFYYIFFNFIGKKKDN